MIRDERLYVDSDLYEDVNYIWNLQKKAKNREWLLSHMVSEAT